MNYQPYCYLIGWSKLDRWYYGSEYSIKSKTANPQNLWVNYFTSSQIVADFRHLHGEPDVIQIRRIFHTAEETVNWEYRVLRKLKVRNNEKWLNVYDGRSPIGRPEPIEKRMAHSIRMTGENNPNYGKVTPDDVRKRISESVRKKAKIKPNGMLGRKHSTESRKKMSINHPRLRSTQNPNFGNIWSQELRDKVSLKKSKVWKFLHPIHGSFEGTISQMLKKFPDLKRTSVVALYSGRLKSYKGWFIP